MWWTGLLLGLAILTPGVVSAENQAAQHSAGETAVAAVLDALHERASAADFDGYFALYHESAVFLGTDRDEYWPLAAFKTYTRARFASGTGWTYHPIQRFVHVAGNVAWFEERLLHETYGETRGTGVLLHDSSGWRVVQYNLTLPIPNDLFDHMGKEIKDFYARLH